MAEARAQTLDAECRLFCRYLTGVAAADDVLVSYRKAHAAGVIEHGTAFDAFLVGLARRGVMATAIADSYAAWFLRTGLLRKKLVLLTAILESRGASARVLDSIAETPPFLVALGLLARGLRFSVALLAALVLLTPVRLGLSLLPARVDAA